MGGVNRGNAGSVRLRPGPVESANEQDEGGDDDNGNNDGVGLFGADLVIQRPPWLHEQELRPPTVPRWMRWVPLVTAIHTVIDMKNASGEVVETALQAEYERAGMTAVRVWANVRGEVAALATVLRKALSTALPDLVAA